MKRLLLVSAVILLASMSFADTSNPEGLPMSSGSNTTTNYQNFQVAGEDVSGVIGGTGYVSGVGLASMIYSPLLPNPGSYIPTVPTSEGEIVSYPNPFNPDSGETANIAYRYAQDVQVKVYIIDITGTILRTIDANSADRAGDGYSRVGWDGRTAFGTTVANGVYLVQIVYNGKTIAKTKIMVLR
ncbi:MAG: T9SS type A sorting domain-containing protein [Candidatus Saganbacteria bacterium]|nr:T9SS type A sorting domain-containing protein [Candidatus Saganbacteria bacterium]